MNFLDRISRALSPKAIWQRALDQSSARDDAIRAEGRKRDEAFRTAYVPPLDAKPQVLRINAFLLLPDHPQRREKAVKLFADRLDDLLKPAGFARSKTTWTRALGKGQAHVSLRRDKGGYICTVDLRYSGPRRLIRADGPGEAMLGAFYRQGVESETDGAHVGWIDYPAIDQDPTCLDFPLRLMRDRALPWLLSHEDGHWPKTENYRDAG